MKNKKIVLDNKIFSTEGGILTAFWRSIIKDNNLENNLDTLVDDYITKVNKYRPSDKSVQNRSKIITNINAREMTWKSFINLVQNVLGSESITLSIKVKFRNGDETFHNIKLPKVQDDILDSIPDEKDIEDKDKDEKSDTKS